MRIETIALKGLLRFADVVTLDLRDVPPGLIALVGANGEGKSTLLEAPIAALYRSFLSRDGELYDYAGDRRDSFLETTIAVDGRGTYRARVNIDGLRRTSDAVLEAIQPNGTRAMLNDGKASTFSAVVAEHFPPKALLLASAFAAQNKAGSFVTLDKKDRKDLFNALLGLDQLIAMGETAKQVMALLDQAKGRLTAVRDELARSTTEGIRELLDREVQHLTIDHEDAEQRQRQLHTTISALEARLATVQDQVAAYAAASQRVKTLESELATRREERRRVDADREAADIDCTKQLQRLVDAREAQLTDIATKIAGNARVREKAEGIRAAVAAIVDLDLQLEACRAQERTLTTRSKDALGNVRATERAIRDLDQLQADRHRIAADADVVRTVPCGGAGEMAACRFLTNAQAAQRQLPEFDGKLADRPAYIARLATDVADAAEVEAALVGVQTRVQLLSAERVRHQLLAQYAEALAAAEARIGELEQKRTEVTERYATDDADLRARTTARLDNLEERGVWLDTVIARLGLEFDVAQADLDTTAAGNAKAVTLQAELAAGRGQWDETTRTIARLEAGVADLERRRRELAEKRQRVEDLQDRLTRLDTERLEWQLLMKAFSRDGLPVLEIDAAGPTIAAYVNEILLACFGPRFTVDLITQRPSADGKKMIDDFSITIFDNLLGGARDIADLSGGEQVIVSEALRNAIAVYVNTRSPMPIRTCWRDETTGALDPENATRYLAMLRKVHELGGFHHLLFISHNPDAAALADAQIRVHDGRADIVYAPYQEAA